jgi:hypothetical protein
VPVGLFILCSIPELHLCSWRLCMGQGCAGAALGKARRPLLAWWRVGIGVARQHEGGGCSNSCWPWLCSGGETQEEE